MLALVEVFFTPLQSVVTLVTLSLLSSSRESSLPTFSLSLACSFSLSSFSHARLPFARVLSLLFLSLSFSSQRRVLPFYLLGHVSRGVSNATAPPLPQAITPHLIVAAPSRRLPVPRGISAKGGMPSGEPCPRPDAKDTSCPLRPCCALARAEPLQLRSSSGCKRYILNALLMLRTSWCRRYTLKVTCRLNVRAHSSSSLPLQSAAYASASTRSLCAPQRAHNAVSFCPVCLSSGQRPTSRAPAARRAPCYRLVWRFGGRAPPLQLQRVLALSPA